jgi:hypothetical protein
LGVAAREDKIVPYAVGTVLNQIGEEDFLGFRNGIRPGRGQPDARDALWVGIERQKVKWILDLDIRSFFDQLQPDWLVRFVEHRKRRQTSRPPDAEKVEGGSDGIQDSGTRRRRGVRRVRSLRRS